MHAGGMARLDQTAQHNTREERSSRAPSPRNRHGARARVRVLHPWQHSMLQLSHAEQVDENVRQMGLEVLLGSPTSPVALWSASNVLLYSFSNVALYSLSVVALLTLGLGSWACDSFSKVLLYSFSNVALYSTDFLLAAPDCCRL